MMSFGKFRRRPWKLLAKALPAPPGYSAGTIVIRTSERKLLLLRRERGTVRTLSRRDERVHLRR